MPHLVSPSARLPRYLTQLEVRSFFEVVSDPRDRTLFSLIYHYGLRVAEASLLRRSDVNLERNRIIIRRLKGGAWTEQPLFSVTAALIQRHLGATDGNADQPLFAGRNGALQKRQIQSLFSRYRDLARLDRRYTCHGLRHSIATHLLDAGVALEFVQDHLGHQSIRSTSIYARITDHHRVALFRKLERSAWIVHPQPSLRSSSEAP